VVNLVDHLDFNLAINCHSTTVDCKMQTVTEMALRHARRGAFTREEVGCWSDRGGAALDGMLKRAVAAGEVYRVRRGFFVLAVEFQRSPINSLDLAQRICGPSYISQESALAHWGWIPEGVQAVTSVTGGRSRTFDTPLGVFTYTRVPQSPLFAGVRRETDADGGGFLIADPLKALADYVYTHRCDWAGVDPLPGSLRIDEGDLADLTPESFDRIDGVHRSSRVRRFLKGLRKDLKL
jgi:predicted transcriptional regulator of viral defense system